MTQNISRDKSKKRATILDGAIDVFINMGFELASMDKIAETAGVSKRTVYNHFGSKENLFQAIVDDFLAQRQSLKTITYNPEEYLAEQLLAFANAEIFLIDSPKRLGLSRFLTRVFLNDIKYARETVSKYPPSHLMLLNWLKEAVEDNKIKSDNLLLTARVFYAMIEGAITWPALFTDGINKAAVEPMISEIITTFLARYGNA
ncbi:MAG: transcriptional regulator TetR family [Herbinix sp.]|jgi:TetR/AcrR family transcriptional regulator of autoinduction and epiphytic fitness|nr:transcriptional regulator TetR family [Herbinix sp.]